MSKLSKMLWHSLREGGPTQPPSPTGQEMAVRLGPLAVRGEVLVRLNGTMTCLPAAPRVKLSISAGNSTINSYQSAAMHFQDVKHFWTHVRSAIVQQRSQSSEIGWAQIKVWGSEVPPAISRGRARWRLWTLGQSPRKPDSWQMQPNATGPTPTQKLHNSANHKTCCSRSRVARAHSK